MMKFLILALCFLVTQCVGFGPIVETPLGKIQGYHAINYNGTKFSAFEGIPYALPPIGQQRFEEPQPIQPWYGTWNATFPYACAQTWFFSNPNTYTTERAMSGDEDCLYINVYVPRDNPDYKELLDVIVHINTASVRPDCFMERDVVFVTLSYRLGVFGFLSTEDDVVSGNNGLKDQVMALKWIQDNIASFGGNPNSVTLTGWSFGAAETHLHYFSSMSQGLFHRGFSQSGTALNSWVIYKNPLKKAQLLGELVGCPHDSSKILVKCLKQKNYKEILNQIIHLAENPSGPINPFGPVVEKSLKPFLTKHPYKLLEEGKVLDVPWLTSTLSHEGFTYTKVFKDNIKNMNEDWNAMAPFWLHYNHNFPETLWNVVAKKIRDFYLGENNEVTPENLDKFVKIFGDRNFVVGAAESAKLQASVTSSPVYYYEFSYLQEPARQNGHGEDGKFLYYCAGTGSLSDDDVKMKDLLMDMLVSYAKTGRPTIEGVQWEPTKSDQLALLNISTFRKEEIRQVLVDEEFCFANFWESLGLGLQNSWN